MTDIAPVRRIVATPTFIDGSLRFAGDEVMAIPKTHPEGHPKAGQITEQPFGSNLIAPTEAAALTLKPEPGETPEGVPVGSVLVNGVWYAPVVLPGSTGGAGGGDADKEPLTLDRMGKTAIAAALTAKGVAFPANATKAALIELAEAHNITIPA